MNFLSGTLIIRFDNETKSILVEHPDRENYPYSLVNIRHETYSAMDFDAACNFIGSRVVLLIPALREQYKEDIERLASSETGSGVGSNSDTRNPRKT